MKYYVFDNATYGQKFFKGAINIPDRLLTDTNKIIEMVCRKFPKLGKSFFISQTKSRPRKTKEDRIALFQKQKKSVQEETEISSPEIL